MSRTSLGLVYSMNTDVQCLCASGSSITTTHTRISKARIIWNMRMQEPWIESLVSYPRRLMLEHTHHEGQGGHWEIVLSVIYMNIKYHIYLYVFRFLDFHKRYEVQIFCTFLICVFDVIKMSCSSGPNGKIHKAGFSSKWSHLSALCWCVHRNLDAETRRQQTSFDIIGTKLNVSNT
jgi:hypothetical protein